MKVNPNPFVRALVKLRMAYADIRGHHGKCWNYEPSNYYMGMQKSKKYKNDRAVRQDGSATSLKVL